ncbi:MAG: hypothetical protein H6873_04345 [Hyphomicrobiaceae bacterium]|nr:hypothetical protein [Hyphomicrobiaceae bacterium]
MDGLIYEESSVWSFLFVTILLGGGAAWATGRMAALEWRPYPVLVVQLLLLGLGVRFVHHALFSGSMFSLQYYLVDTLILLVLGSLGFRYTRTSQMVRQYHWLYERVSPLSWRERGGQS